MHHPLRLWKSTGRISGNMLLLPLLDLQRLHLTSKFLMHRFNLLAGHALGNMLILISLHLRPHVLSLQVSLHLGVPQVNCHSGAMNLPQHIPSGILWYEDLAFVQ